MPFNVDLFGAATKINTDILCGFKTIFYLIQILMKCKNYKRIINVKIVADNAENERQQNYVIKF